MKIACVFRISLLGVKPYGELKPLAKVELSSNLYTLTSLAENWNRIGNFMSMFIVCSLYVFWAAGRILEENKLNPICYSESFYSYKYE